MAGIQHRSPPSEAAGDVPAALATEFIRNTYVSQATALLGRGLYADAEHYLRESLRLRPDDADALNKLGTVIWQQGRSEEAGEFIQRAFELDPDDFAIVSNLAASYWEQGCYQEAALSYRRATELKSDCFEAWLYLGAVLIRLGEFDESIRCLAVASRLRPDAPEPIATTGAALFQLGRFDEAMACYDEALRRKPDYAECHRSRALALLADGDYERAWPEYEWRFLCRKQPCRTPAGPRWNGEDLNGRTILLYAEQGLGDTLHFIRYAAFVKERGARAMVLCHLPLVRLIALCPDVDGVFDNEAELPPYDFRVPLMSLPGMFGTTLKNIPAKVPYLAPDLESIATWQAVVDVEISRLGLRPRLKIGIAWQGSKKTFLDCWRSFRLEQLAPLAAVPGACLVSLQKDAGVEQLETLAGRFPVVTLPGSIASARASAGNDRERDFLDTAAVASQLDLVIAPDTAVAHLAGSLGLPVWVPLSKVCDWRWLKDREDCPWYPTARLFRQTTDGDWDSVFEQMAAVLRELLSHAHDNPRGLLPSVPGRITPTIAYSTRPTTS
jgi:Flp pilus assembly protein TadD